MQRKIILLISVLFLAIIPFFWLKLGQMDLGGDSSRLYFYDPLHYLSSFPLYAITPNGFGSEATGYYLIPYIFLLYIIKKLFVSPYLLITFFNSFSLIVAFLTIYGIVVTLLKNSIDNIRNDNGIHFAGILAGLFYTFSPVLTFIGWDNALFNHNQFFLNPLLFYLLLKYLYTKNIRYGLSILLVTFLFAPNFSPSPYLFSFIIFAIAYLFIYTVIISKIRFNVKQLIVLSLLFIVIHLFHLYPLFANVFLQGSALNESTFSNWGKFDRGLSYFSIITKDTKLSNNLAGIVQGDTKGIVFDFLWVLFPILITIGLVLRKKAQEADRNFLFVIFFFLLTLFFATANITNIGLEFYKLLFNIPGFSMFRNYYGQFSHVFVFFYTLVFGYSFFYIFSSLTKHKKTVFLVSLSGLIIVSALPFINGKRVTSGANKGTTKEIPFQIKMDPVYEDFLEYVRKNNLDGKYLSLPMDDFGYEILGGRDGGVYRGPPAIAYLAGKKEYSGAIGLGLFSDIFLNAVRQGDYNSIKTILSILNIRYIFYNSDSYIYPDYSENYTGWPFAQTKSYMPQDQDLYQKFIDNLPVKKKMDFGKKYHLYELEVNNFVPLIYIAKQNLFYDQSTTDILVPLSFFNGDLRIALYNSDSAKVSEKIQSYLVSPVKNTELSSNNAQIIGSPISREFYTLIHPLMVLDDRRKYEDPELNRDKKFQDGFYNIQQVIKEFTLLDSQDNLQKQKAETYLTKYDNAVKDLITQLKDSKDSFYSSINSQNRLWTMLVQHEYLVYETIKRSTNLFTEDKNSLTTLADTLFNNLYSLLQSDIKKPRDIFYSLDSASGDYEVFIEKAKLKKNSLKDTRVNIDTQVNNVAEFQDKGEWIGFNDLHLESNNKNLFMLRLPYYPGFLDSIAIQNLDNSNTKTQNYKIENDVILNYTNWLIKQYTEWKPNVVYFISFDYITNSNSLSENTQWKSYKAIIEFIEGGKSAILKIISDEKTSLNRIEDFNTAADIKIKNVLVLGLDYPKIVLKKKDPTEDRKINTPQIVFTKINPTKYKVKVIGVKDPYTLVFLDGFSKNWKLFLKKPDESINKIITASYFNNEIKEGVHSNSFLERSTFETWGSKPIADEKHTMVNGYANAWYITPEDTSGLTDYTFILELTTQRAFYPLFFISLTVVGICTAWFIVILFKSYIIPGIRKGVKK